MRDYVRQQQQKQKSRENLDEHNGLVGPLPITKQVLSEEEFNRTQKDSLDVNRGALNQYMNKKSNQATPEAIEPYQRKVQAETPKKFGGRRNGYQTDLDVKYNYHPPPKWQASSDNVNRNQFDRAKPSSRTGQRLMATYGTQV